MKNTNNRLAISLLLGLIFGSAIENVPLGLALGLVFALTFLSSDKDIQ